MDQASLSFCLWLSGIVIAVAISYYMIRYSKPPYNQDIHKCNIETYEDIDYGADHGTDYGEDIKDKIDNLIPKVPAVKPPADKNKKNNLCLLI